MYEYTPAAQAKSELTLIAGSEHFGFQVSLLYEKPGKMRQNYQTGAPWESMVGYSRAVRAGSVIEVSGTVAIEDGKPYSAGDAYKQTRKILDIIEGSLAHFGASLSDVVRTRMYVTDIANWEAVGRAHGEVFRDIMPATSMVEVSALIALEYVVEIEVTAVLDERIEPRH